MWIVPVSIGTAAMNKSGARIQWPWFTHFFCLAVVANAYLSIGHAAYPVLKHLGIIGLIVTLFLIGTKLSRQAIRKVGASPMLQGVILWLIVATTSRTLTHAGSAHPSPDPDPRPDALQ
jgi:uncharacterized membrane protein YadS